MKTNYRPKLRITLAILSSVIILGVNSCGSAVQSQQEAGAVASPTICDVHAGLISLAKRIIFENETINVSAQVDNPSGRKILYNWHAQVGKMSLSGRTPAIEATYTAPAQPVEDIISVDIQPEGCAAIILHQTISVVVPPPVPDNAAGGTPITYLPPIFDRPNSELTFVQFDYDPTYERGSLRLYFCTSMKYYRIKSVEIQPNPRVLVDRAYPNSEQCTFKYPVIDLMVGDIETVGIGTGEEPSKTYSNMQFYTIKRTEHRLELVKPAIIPTPLP